MAHQMGSFQTIDRLPDEYYQKIGLILTKWGYFEWCLREALYVALKIGPKQGRLTIGNPRATDLISRIEDVMALDSLTTSINFSDLRRVAKKILEIRNDLAHGVWVDHSGDFVLQKVTGDYQAEPGGPSISARIDPQAVLLLPPEMDRIATNIDNMIRGALILQREIEAQIAGRPPAQP